jgi:hypothetical protein
VTRPPSLILTLAGLLASNSVAKIVLFAFAAACFVVTSFSVWAAERKERMRLEREAGPNILLKVVKSDGSTEQIDFVNDGDDTALNVEFEESAEDPIKAYGTPWTTPFVKANQSQFLTVLFYKKIGSSQISTDSIADLFADYEETVPLAVRFENTKGVRFRRRFTLRRHFPFNEFQCYAGVRERVTLTRTR